MFSHFTIMIEVSADMLAEVHFQSWVGFGEEYFFLCRSQLRSKQFKVMMSYKLWLYFCSSVISPNPCHIIAHKYKTKNVGKNHWPRHQKSMVNFKTYLTMNHSPWSILMTSKIPSGVKNHRKSIKPGPQIALICFLPLDMLCMTLSWLLSNFEVSEEIQTTKKKKTGFICSTILLYTFMQST